MRTALLFLLSFAAQADILLNPTVPGGSAKDYTKPGLRIQDGVIYQTRPGPLGIINQMGTTYKREGNMLVPHKGILGPQDFSKPSLAIENDD